MLSKLIILAPGPWKVELVAYQPTSAQYKCIESTDLLKNTGISILVHQCGSGCKSLYHDKLQRPGIFILSRYLPQYVHGDSSRNSDDHFQATKPIKVQHTSHWNSIKRIGPAQSWPRAGQRKAISQIRCASQTGDMTETTWSTTGIAPDDEDEGRSMACWITIVLRESNHSMIGTSFTLLPPTWTLERSGWPTHIIKAY